MRRRGTPYFIVLAVTTWVTRHFWWPSNFVVAFDTGTYSAPNWILGKRAFLDGRLPLINDNIFGGVPHLGNPQTGVLSPLRWLSYLFDPTRGLNMLAASHLLILGFGMVFLARRLGMSRLAATSVGIVAVLCGASTTKSIQVEQIMVIAWLPWVLAFIRMVIAHPTRRTYIGLLSIAISMAILSGHPQMTYELALTSGVFAVGLLIGSHPRWRSLASLGAAVAASALTCALQLVAALAATGDSFFSEGRELGTLQNGALILKARSSLQAIFGTVFAGRSDVFAGTFESITYLGVVAVLMAATAIAVALRHRDTRTWALPLVLVAIIGLVWSLGPRTPVFRVAFHLLPGFDQARVSSRWLIVVSLIVALFVGHAVDLVRQSINRLTLRIMLGTAGIIMILVVSTPIQSGDTKTKIAWLVSGGLVLVAFRLSLGGATSTRERVARVLVLLLAIEMLLLDRSSVVHDVVSDVAIEDMIAADTDYLASTDGFTLALTDDGGPPTYLVPALRPNANAMFDISSIDGYDGGVQVTRRWGMSLRRFSETPAYDFPLRNALPDRLDAERLARLGVRHVVLDVADDPTRLVPEWIGPVANDDRFTVWENPAWLGAAWVYWSSDIVEGEPADALRTNFAEFQNTAIVDRSSAILRCESACQPLGVSIDTIDPEHVRVEVDLDRTGLVVLPRQALDGWRVSVDGEHHAVLNVDGLYMGVVVPEGRHVIEWRYRPRWVTPSAWASILGVLVTLGLLLEGRPRRWRRNTPSALR